LLVHLPGQDDGFERDELVYNMDLMPTLFELIDLRMDAEIDAQSLQPYLGAASNSKSGREALLLEFHGIRYLHTQRGLVTRDGYKYIFNPDDEDELYDLNADPVEMHNLLQNGDHSRADELRQQLITLSRAYGDPVQDCIAKWFGQWRNFSGQPDVSSQYTTTHLK
jgi:arylsulfatase A-like enzyme